MEEANQDVSMVAQRETGIESRSELTLSEPLTLSGDGIEVTYETYKGSEKTLTGVRPRTPSFVSDEDKPYPEMKPTEAIEFSAGDSHYILDTEKPALYSFSWGTSRSFTTVASGDAIVSVYTAEFVPPAPVCGDVIDVSRASPRKPDSVDATIHYLTNRGNDASFEMRVTQLDGTGDRLQLAGERLDNGKRVEVFTDCHRKITHQSGRKVGTTTRVEFPRGTQLTVNIEGDSDVDVDALERHIQSYFNGTTYSDANDPTVEITATSELDWENKRKLDLTDTERQVLNLLDKKSLRTEDIADQLDMDYKDVDNVLSRLRKENLVVIGPNFEFETDLGVPPNLQ